MTSRFLIYYSLQDTENFSKLVSVKRSCIRLEMYSSTECDARVEEVVEKDDDEREVEVYLVRRPIKCISPQVHDICKLSRSWFHWALVFKFQDDGNTVRRFEIKKKGNYMEAHVEEDWPRVAPIKNLLGIWKSSPKKLLTLAKTNKLNKRRYSPHNSNCQHWVKEMAKDLPDSIREKLNGFRALGNFQFV